MTTEPNDSFIEKRLFPRVKAPVFCRPAGFLKPRYRTGNISLGGVRIFTEAPIKEGRRLEIELFLPDNQTIVAIVRVVWLVELPPGSEARYDVGLEFIRLYPEDAQKIQIVLDTSLDKETV